MKIVNIQFCWALTVCLRFVSGFHATNPATSASTRSLLSLPLDVAPLADISISTYPTGMSEIPHDLLTSAHHLADQAASAVASFVLNTADVMHQHPNMNEPQLGGKLYHLSTEKLVEILHQDIHERNSLVTADFTRSIYENTCIFKDGSGLDGAYPMMPWILGCKLLFNGDKSRARIVKDSLQVSGQKITFRFESDLEFRGPFSPQVLLSGRVEMLRNPETGLISSYREIWDKDVLDIVKNAKLQVPAFAKGFKSALDNGLSLLSDHDESVVLAPSKTKQQFPTERHTAIVLFPGCQMEPSQYQGVAKTIQENSEQAVWVIIPKMPLNMANPLTVPALAKSSLGHLQSQGYPANTTFVGGHSLGGVFLPSIFGDRGLQENQVDGLIHLSAFLS